MTATLPAAADPVAAALSESTTKLDIGGTHRMVPAEQTLDRVRPLCRFLGITRVANITGLDWLGIPVVAVYRPNSRSLSVSQGKGVTLAAARASGVMEAAELAHAERIDRPLRLSSYAELSRTDLVADVSRLPFAAGRRFNEHVRMLWIEGYDLVQSERLWVPLELVSMDATGQLPGAGCFQSTSNGLASGNHLLEAVSHAICELVERDATTLWQLGPPDRQRATSVDLASVADPVCVGVLSKMAAAGMEVLAWDITSDIGIPAFSALIAEPPGDRARAIFTSMGMGCHPSHHIALLRALTEAAQSRLTLIAGSRDDVFRDEYRLSRQRLDALRVYRQFTGPNGRRVGGPSPESETFQDDVRWQVARLVGRGFDRIIVCDLTDPSLGLPVVRVVVPGLESYRGAPDYVPGARARALREGSQSQ